MVRPSQTRRGWSVQSTDGGDGRAQAVALGHAHRHGLAVAGWRTREKAARTYHGAPPDAPISRASLRTPRRSSTKPWKRTSPGDLRPVKERIAAAVEITGGTWVEPDTNSTGGESLVRQFCSPCWVRQDAWRRDAVALLAGRLRLLHALPQIIAASNATSTSKTGAGASSIASRTTPGWRGWTGREVLTHPSTTPEAGTSMLFTYNSQMRPVDVQGTWDSYRQRRRQRRAAGLLFGWGDGGGGPTQTMLDLATVGRNLPGLPYVAPDKAGVVLRAASPRGGPQGVARVGRRAVPGVSPGHVHLAGTDQARTAWRRSRPQRGVACWPTCWTGGRVSCGRAERGLGAHPAQPVPRHPARLLHPAGLRGRRARLRARHRHRA